MPTRKQPKKQEPLLSVVARKLGHAAGTLTKATHELTESISVLPETVTARLRKPAEVGAPGRRRRSKVRHPKKRTHKAAPVRKSRIKKSSRANSKSVRAHK